MSEKMGIESEVEWLRMMARTSNRNMRRAVEAQIRDMMKYD